nr:uncharacterized protein LOC121825012 isoform X4 [Peromyscus maniculatus bairdii]
MVTSDTSQSPGAEARSCTGPLGGYGAAPEDTSPPLPLQDPTRGAETMRRRRLSEAAGPHLLHRVSAPPSLTLAGWQAGEGEGGRPRKTVLLDHGNGHSGSPRMVPTRILEEPAG